MKIYDSRDRFKEVKDSLWNSVKALKDKVLFKQDRNDNSRRILPRFSFGDFYSRVIWCKRSAKRIFLDIKDDNLDVVNPMEYRTG